MTCGSQLAAAVSPFERLHGIERKRQVTKYQEPKIIQEKEILLYVEDDMRVPFCSSGLNVSKAAQDQKKNEVARNQGVKKIQEERFQLGCIWTSGPSNYPAWPFDSYNFSPLQNRKVRNFLNKTGKSYASQKQKNKEIQHISLFM